MSTASAKTLASLTTFVTQLSAPSFNVLSDLGHSYTK